MLRFSIKTVILFFLSEMCLSQSSNTGNWFYYLGNNAISKKISLHSEVQYRNFNVAGDLEQLLLRTGVGYNLSENNNNILLGYAFVKTERYITESDKVSFDENRLFQQFITKQSFSRFHLTHRYRMEERWIENSDMAIRFRYLIGINIPLNKKSIAKNAIYLSGYNEIFIHTNGQGFDRDRIYGGLGYCISKNLKLELGYMRQQLSGRSRDQSVLTLINSMPFYKVTE